MRAPLSFGGHASEGTFLDPYNEDGDQEYHHFPRSRSSGARTRPRRGLQRRPAIENLRVYGTKIRLDVKPRRLPHGERWPDLNDILSMQGGHEHGHGHHRNIAKVNCGDRFADVEHASDDLDHDFHQSKRLKEWHSSNDDHGSSIDDDYEDDKKEEEYSLHHSLPNPDQNPFEAMVMSDASSIATASETSSFSCSSCSISRIAEEVFFARHILPGAAKLVEVGSKSSKIGGSGSAGGGGGGGGTATSFRASDSYNSGIQSSSDNSLGQLVTTTINVKANADIINNGSGDTVDVEKQHELVKQFPRVIRIIRKHSVLTLLSLDDIDADDDCNEQQPIYEMAYASRMRKVPRMSYQADESKDTTGGGGEGGEEVKNIWRQVDVKPPRTLRTQTPRNTRWPFRAELPDPARHDCIAAWARGVQPGGPTIPDWE